MALDAVGIRHSRMRSAAPPRAYKQAACAPPTTTHLLSGRATRGCGDYGGAWEVGIALASPDVRLRIANASKGARMCVIGAGAMNSDSRQPNGAWL